MNIAQEKIDDLNAVLTVQITKEDYQEDVDKALRHLRKNAKLPGFRPGKVPMGLIKKSHGRSVLAEELNKVINKSIGDYIAEQKLNVLGSPLPQEGEDGGDWDNPDTFEFKYEVGLAPEFEVKISKREKFQMHQIEVAEDMVDKEVEEITRRYGKLETPEAAGEKDMLFGDFLELDADGNIVEGGIQNQGTVSIEFLEDKKVKKELTGAKLGDTFTVDPKSVSKGDEDLAKLLGIEIEAARSIESKFQFNVTDIKAIVPAELNEELFEKLYGEGTDVKTAEDLRNKIKAGVSTMFQKDSDRLLKKQITEKLIAKHKIELPDTFLKKWIKASNEKPLSDEQLEAEYPQYADGLRMRLIENKLAESEGIKIEFDDMVNFTKGIIAENYRRSGMEPPEDEELMKHATQALRNREEAEQISQMAFDEKLMAYFKENLKIEEKSVSYEEFIKLMQL